MNICNYKYNHIHFGQLAIIFDWKLFKKIKAQQAYQVTIITTPLTQAE